MNKKLKVLLIAITILIIIAGVLFYYYKVFKSSADALLLQKNGFVWGVTMDPNALGVYTSNTYQKEIGLAYNLGVGYARLEWQYDGRPDPFTYQDQIFKQIQKSNLSIYLITEASSDIQSMNNPYQNGYDSLFKIATRYKGRIQYYQLLNEVATQGLENPNATGENISDYDQAKCTKLRGWIEGASAAIRQADPNAKIVITDQWTHYAFFQMLQDHKVDYDIIGWDWYSSMGLMSDKKLANGQTLLDELKTFNKPIMLTEVNQTPDGANGQLGMNEQEQNTFISQMANWAYANKDAIDGFIVMQLMDVTNTGRGYTDHYGLVNSVPVKTGSVNANPGAPRPAYYTLKDIIAKDK